MNIALQTMSQVPPLNPGSKPLNSITLTSGSTPQESETSLIMSISKPTGFFESSSSKNSIGGTVGSTHAVSVPLFAISSGASEEASATVAGELPHADNPIAA